MFGVAGLDRLIGITVLMSLGCGLPAFVARMRTPSRTLLLLSTGGLVALFGGELIPEVLQKGGGISLGIILAVWFGFSRIPGLHHHGSGHEHDGHDHEHSYPGLLVLSMGAHAIASGALLFTASNLSGAAADAAFGALLAHKGYEAISVSSLLRDQVTSDRKYAFWTGLYLAAFPFGFSLAAITARLMGGDLVPSHVELAAVVLGSIAIGTLMSCVLHDFLMPSLRRVRERKLEAIWIALGAVIALWLTRSA